MTKKPKTKTETEPTIFDPKKLTDEDLAKVFEDERLFKHPRFKQLNDKAKEADKLAKQKEKEIEDKLLEEKKYQELLDKKEARIKELEQSVNQSRVDNALLAEATRAGAVDAEAVLKLVDRTKVSMNDDGTVVGATEAVKSLLEAKTFLVGKSGDPKLGEGTNPAGGNASPKFKLSQLEDAEFYRENEKEIRAAMAQGLVENDLPR